MHGSNPVHLLLVWLDGSWCCREHFLAARSLKEAAALAAQLQRIVASQLQHAGPLAAAAVAVAGKRLPMQPASPKVNLRLRRALAAGWADQVNKMRLSVPHQSSVGTLVIT